MTKLYDSEIKQILPDALVRKAEVQALSYALRQAIRRLMDDCKSISVYAAIESLPEEMLDLLAVELGTQYYDTALPIENKRELVAGTMVWYLTSGAPSAVEELVAAVFGEGEVKEWFEYGGEPYYFKVRTNAPLRPDILEQFAQILNNVKNARSHIESVDVERTARLVVYAGGAFASSTVKNDIPENRLIDNDIYQQEIYAGAAQTEYSENYIS